MIPGHGIHIASMIICLTAVAPGEQYVQSKRACEPSRELPVHSWICEPGRPGDSVLVDGDFLAIHRGALGRERYLSRAYIDLNVQPGAQYVFQYDAQIDGWGKGRVFCYIGNATAGWGASHMVWSQPLPSGSVEDGTLPIVVPADGGRIRLCVAAEGPEVTARFSGLSLQLAIPHLVLSPATGAVRLDGRLDDALWNDATKLTPMRLLEDITRFAHLPTEMWVAIRDGWLWIAVRCPEPDPRRMRLGSRTIFERCNDDCIEVYLSKDQRDYTKFIVNALGKCAWRRVDGKCAPGRTWYTATDTGYQENTPGIESQTHIDRRHKVWTCEMRLRLADIYGREPGGRVALGLNIVRHRPQTDEEYVTWSLLPGRTNHAPQSFGSVILDLPEARATPATPAGPALLALTARLEVPEVLLPATPVCMATGPGRFVLPSTLRVEDRGVGIDPGVIEDLREAMRVADGVTVDLSLAIAPEKLSDPTLDADQQALLAGPEAFRLELSGTTASISGRSRAGVLRGLATLTLISERARIAARDLPDLVLLDAPAMAVRGWFLHDSKASALTQGIDVAFRLRLNHLLIGVDSFGGPTAFPYTSAPISDLTRTKQEWSHIFDYARARGIEPIPYIASWGRTQYITRLPQYRHLMVSDRGVVDGGTRNLDVANPESHAVMLALQEEVIDTLQPKALCIAFDEIHYAELVTSEAARAKGWKPSDWVIEALTVNANFLRRKGVRMWLWGDMLDPEQNGRHLDLSGPELIARLPRDDMTILDWKYHDTFFGPPDYPSLGMFTSLGLPTIGCPWFSPNNIAELATAVRRHGAQGMIQTSWHMTDPPHMRAELARAVALTARVSWSPAEATLAHVTTVPNAAFAFALPRREAALGPARMQRPVMVGDGLADEAEVARLFGWPGARLDFLTAPVRNPRQIELRPFLRNGRPAALVARAGSSASIDLSGPLRALTFLHATNPRQLVGALTDNNGLLSTPVGTYIAHYADGGSERIRLAYRENVGGINDPALGPAMDPAIYGTLAHQHFVNLASHTWINPRPEQPLRSLEVVAGPSPDSALLLVALTAE